MYSQPDYMQSPMQNESWNDNALPMMNLPSALDYGSAMLPTPKNDMPEALSNPMYTPAFLAQHVGKMVRVEFQLNNSTTERMGRLAQVGADYIVLQSPDNAGSMMGDLNAVTFVTIMNESRNPMLL